MKTEKGKEKKNLTLAHLAVAAQQEPKVQPTSTAQQQPAVQPSPAQHTPSRKNPRQEIVLILFLAWWTARRCAPLLLSAGASSLLDGVTRRALVQYKDPWTNPSLPFFFLCSISPHAETLATPVSITAGD
jgi:hypothetical protein